MFLFACNWVLGAVYIFTQIQIQTLLESHNEELFSAVVLKSSWGSICWGKKRKYGKKNE